MFKHKFKFALITVWSREVGLWSGWPLKMSSTLFAIICGHAYNNRGAYCGKYGISYPVLYPVQTEQNYLVRELDYNLECDPEDVPVYMGHSLFNTTKQITLFSHCNIAIHLISRLKLSRSPSRLSVYTGQSNTIQIAI